MKLPITILLVLFSLQLAAQKRSPGREINWQNSRTTKLNNTTIHYLYFDGAAYPNTETFLPYFTELTELEPNTGNISVKLQNQKYETFDDNDLKNIKYQEQIPEVIEVKASVSYIRKNPYARISFIPVRKNPVTGKPEKLVGFSFSITQFPGTEKATGSRTYRNNSLLSSGTWYKIKVKQDGVYRLSYATLRDEMGFSDPEDIRIFGYGGGMLPVVNNEVQYDDLVENAILVEDGGDGDFGPGDYVLFYGQGPVEWKYDAANDLFYHNPHLYSDATYYFVTSNNGTTKTIEQEAPPSGSVTHNITTFTDRQYHDVQSENLIKSGQLWVGEHFDIDTDHDFSFSFPNIVSGSEVKMKTYLISRSSSVFGYCYFDLSVNGYFLTSLPVNGINLEGNTYANKNISTNTFNSSGNYSGDNLTIGISYNKSTSTAEGWLNYILLNANRQLTMSGNQMHFRDTSAIGPGNIANFVLDNAGSDIRIWDITDPVNVRQIVTSPAWNTLTFNIATDSLREFIAFKNTGYLSPEKVGPVTNQNLHGLPQTDMVIVYHPDFVSHAEQVADIHRNNDNLHVTLATPQQIYNEFSSGTPDIMAIRLFLKMFYDRAGNEDEMPDYLFLLGDGSYDNINTSVNNSNFIPTYQSAKSLSGTESFVTDDFYGMLDDNEGNIETSGNMDIGIGRFPVRTAEEAQGLIDKIVNYISGNTMGDWRNSLCFIADDEDNNEHMYYSNQHTNMIDTTYPAYNIHKIFLDAYPQVSTSGGERYPDVNTAINDMVNKGALIINYMGHGNEIRLAHEYILGINDVIQWDNFDKPPLIITASCEVGRFDDYSHTSIGEHLMLNPNGAGIAAITTTRLVFSGSNNQFCSWFYNYAFELNEDNEHYRLGDLVRETKNHAVSSNTLRFALLGDPALTLAYPEHRIATTAINQTTVSGAPDTLKALSKVTISGYIHDIADNKLNNFNGVLYPTVYDKKTTVSTLGNDGGSSFNFSVRNSIIYKGKASITNGDFTFSFIVPKDISYNLGYGKISYYGDNTNNGGSEDANGYYENIIIGGSLDTVYSDNEGPLTRLYMNDSTFIFGGTTDENPTLLAFVQDSNGINTVGNGIGHDITAVLDDNTYQTMVLNDFYEADIDSYQKGRVEYPMSDISDGFHSLKFKIWDVLNNSSEDYIEFFVAESEDLVLDNIFNYPNPFTTKTSFFFDHNQPNKQLDVLIQVFTVTGKLVKTIQRTIFTDGFRSDPIDWDGLDDYGDKIGRGVYIYKVKVRSEDGKTVDKFEKLVILR